MITYEFDLGFIGFVLLVILNSQTSPDIFLNFFYSILSFFYDFETDFSFNDIKSISLFEILNDITNIITGPHDTNFFKLKLENNHIIKELITPDELEKILIEPMKNIFPLDKKKNKNKNKIKNDPIKQKKSKTIYENKPKEIHNEKIKKGKFQQNKSENEEFISNNEIIVSKKEEDSKGEEDSKEEEKSKEGKKESKKGEESKQKDKGDKKTRKKAKEDIQKEDSDKIIKQLLEQNENLLNEFNNMKKKLNELTENNNTLIEKNNILETRVNKLTQKDKKKSKIISDIQLKMTKVENDLIIIKFRDTIKAFIDYCYKGFAFDLSKFIGYDDKVNEIISKISHLKYKAIYDENTIEILIKLLRNIALQLKSGNAMAHTFDSKKPIFDQIIDNTNDKITNYSILKERFNNLNASDKIAAIVLTREKYYNNRKTLESEEKKIFEDINNLDKKLLMKKLLNNC